jgi:hypothetical protein
MDPGRAGRSDIADNMIDLTVHSVQTAAAAYEVTADPPMSLSLKLILVCPACRYGVFWLVAGMIAGYDADWQCG